MTTLRLEYAGAGASVSSRLIAPPQVAIARNDAPQRVHVGVEIGAVRRELSPRVPDRAEKLARDAVARARPEEHRELRSPPQRNPPGAALLDGAVVEGL